MKKILFYLLMFLGLPVLLYAGTTEHSTWVAAQEATDAVIKSSADHVADNTQAHSDYLLNNTSDTMSGVLTTDGLAVGTNEDLTMGADTLSYDGSTFVFSDDLTVSDEVYGAGWNGSSEVPTKNAVYDKVETIEAASSLTGLSDVNTAAVTAGRLLVADGVDYESVSMSGDNTIAADGAVTIQANAVALTTDTTGNYAAGDAEAGSATSGDSATAFFDTGTIEHERGGLEAAVNSYSGLVAISGGSTSEVDSIAELSAQIADATIAQEGTLTNLKWCTSDGTLINCTEDTPAGGVTDLTDLSDVGDTTATAGRLLVSDGDSFESALVSGDVTIDGTGAITVQPYAISKLTDVTSTDSDYILVLDDTDGALKKVDMGEVRGGGGGTPGGSDTQIQYNNGGSFGGIASFIWDDSNVEVANDVKLAFGTDADYSIQYDESVDDQLLIETSATDAGAVTDPMIEILVGSSPTANQQVFGIAKGSQSSNTPIFTVDEDGDVNTPAGGVFTIGDGNDENGEMLKFDRASSDATLSWDDTNDRFVFSHPVEAGGDSDSLVLSTEALNAKGRIFVADGDAFQSVEMIGDATIDSTGYITFSGAGSGDVTGVGDCASGACLDGTSDGGKYIRLYDGDSNYTEINNDEANQSANLKWILPDANGTAGQVLEIASVSSNDITLEWDDDTSAGSPTYNSISDPDGDGSLSMGAYTGTYTSSTDGWDGMHFVNTAATLTSATTLVTISTNAGSDSQTTFFRVMQDIDGTPNEVFKIGQDGNITTEGNILFDGSSYDFYKRTDSSIGLVQYTSATANAGTAYGMFTLGVDSNNSGVTANQTIFEVGKGGQTPSAGNWSSLFDVDAEGDVTVAGTLTVSGNTIIRDTAGIIIESPTSADSFMFYRAYSDLTITDIDCISESATATTLEIEECDSAGDNCSDIESAITCDVDGASESGAIDNASVDANDKIRANVTGTSGTPGSVSVWITFTGGK